VAGPALAGNRRCSVTSAPLQRGQAQWREIVFMARLSRAVTRGNSMFSHHVHTLLARPRPAAEETPTVLRDGSTVLIRQVRGTDAPMLADGFARLSARSRQLRFLGPKKMLSAAELRYLTDVDHHDHEAIGALSPAEGRGVGITRYIRDADDPRAAEIAVTIADDWQARGQGAELLARLSDRARQAGICRFTATVSADNVAMTGLLWKMGAKLAGRSRGTMEYEVALEAVDDYSLDSWFRCADNSSVLAWP
jgi:RimJ/RimL family protein N-acetyltransferase